MLQSIMARRWHHLSPRIPRHGFTVVELLVVIAIIGILVALILPAVQAAREAARKVECKNHLRQIGTAFHLHHDTYKHFPTNGWGWQWVGDANRGFDQKQPGGWCFNVLPFLEQESARDLATGAGTTAKLLQTPVSVFYCPSRRGPYQYPFDASLPPLRNSAPVGVAAKTDYAVCGGDQIIHTPPGPTSTDPQDVRNYQWPRFQDATGVAYVLTRIRLADITDGASHTAMVGEKYLSHQHYQSGATWGDDQTAFVGDDADNRRWTDEPPRQDDDSDDIQHFGSAHRAGCHFVLCDGSIRLVNYSIDAKVFNSLGNRRDGVPVSLGD